MRRVAIIPARGGSQRIPRKNMRAFAGRPIIDYSVAAARESGVFDRIIVSTDDAEIAGVARRCGAETPFLRPKELADHHTGTAAVVKHSIEWLGQNDWPADYVCCIYATAPFVRAAALREGFAKLQLSGAPYVFSVARFSFPIQRALRLTEAGTLAPLQPEHVLTRSQDLEETYHDAGQFYWGRADAFLSEVPAYCSSALPVILPAYEVQDIDTPEDWRRAELMYAARDERG